MDRHLCLRSLNFFCSSNGISHITSPPYHPSSNEQAENSVRMFKSSFYKMLLDPINKTVEVNDIIHRFLYLNRNTTHSTTNKTPYQIMFDRQGLVRWELLKPKEQIENNRENIKKIEVSDIVYVKDFKTKKWVKGKVIEILGKCCYRILINGNLKWKRHANHVTKALTNADTDKPQKDTVHSESTLNDVLNEKVKMSAHQPNMSGSNESDNNCRVQNTSNVVVDPIQGADAVCLRRLFKF